ncbi:hypothetical protein GF327_07095 [Candidatus Woesearchaeota archaeon]|nr:hypothetical protein [Candidatus Woesearchaeota archaeon]
MSSRRNRLEVIYDILKAISKDNRKIRKTHILYKANLSHSLLEEYLDELIEKEFIDKISDSGKTTYELTQKGFDYLKEYKKIIDFIDSFGLD